MRNATSAGRSRRQLLEPAGTAAIAKRGKEMLRTRACRTPGLMVVFTAVLGLALPASAGNQVPFRGGAEVVITGAASGSDGLHATAAGEGNATHLGRFTFDEHAVLHEDGTIQTTVVL